MNKKLIRSYLKEVTSALTCKRSVKSVFIHEFLEPDVSNFVADDPSCTIEDLYKEFGTPEKIAANLPDRKEYAELLKRAKRKAIIWKWSCIAIAILTIALIVGLIYLVKEIYSLNGNIDVNAVSYVANIKSILYYILPYNKGA